jgi:hypothetical protein
MGFLQSGLGHACCANDDRFCGIMRDAAKNRTKKLEIKAHAELGFVRESMEKRKNASMGMSVEEGEYEDANDPVVAAWI